MSYNFGCQEPLKRKRTSRDSKTRYNTSYLYSMPGKTRNLLNLRPAELSGGGKSPRTELCFCNKLCCIAVALSFGCNFLLP